MNPQQIGSDDTPAEVMAKTGAARRWTGVPPAAADAAPARFRMRVSAHIPGTSPAVVDVFEPAFRRLHQMSGGAITVEGHWGGSLHKEREGIAALTSGLTDMCPVYSAWDPASFPAAQALCLPFIFPSVEVATAVSEELYHEFFKADVERQGVLMGRMSATSEYNLFSRKPIRRLEDIAGRRIACSDGVEASVIAALGAQPVACSTPEAHKRFGEGDVFAVSISDSAAQTVGIYRNARFRTSANLVRVNLEYGLSRTFYDSLPPDLQRVLNAWLRGAAQAGSQLFYGLAGARARDAFHAAGIEFISLAADEQQRWRDAVAPVEADLRTSLDAAGYPADRLLAALRACARKYEGFSADQLMTRALEHPLLNLLPLPAGETV
ncbi:MAG: TRAP transporter substrate-binding protein DctP [Pseudomonadota bacterium]